MSALSQLHLPFAPLALVGSREVQRIQQGSCVCIITTALAVCLVGAPQRRRLAQAQHPTGSVQQGGCVCIITTALAVSPVGALFLLEPQRQQHHGARASMLHGHYCNDAPQQLTQPPSLSRSIAILRLCVQTGSVKSTQNDTMGPRNDAKCTNCAPVTPKMMLKRLKKSRSLRP